MTPAALAAPVTSLLGDRHSRRDVLLVLALARSGVLALAAALVALDGPPALVLVLAAAFTAIGTGHKPAQAALLPALADEPRQLAASNALWSAVDSAGFLVGALAGGLLVASSGVDVALAFTAVAFALAGVALAGIPRDVRPADPIEPDRREIAEGFRAVAADRGLRVVVGVLGVSTLVEGAIDVLVVLIALQLLDLGAAGVGWLNSAWGLGGAIGGAVAVLLLARGRNAAGLVLASLLVGFPLVLISAWPVTVVALLGLVLLGVGYAVMEVAGLTLVQRLASDAVLARAFGVVEGTYWLTTGLGSLLAPVLVALLGLQGALLAVGLTLPVLVLARWRAIARLEANAPVPEREYALLRGLTLFAPLPVARLEDVARHAETVFAAAGEPIVTEGEPGDRFYVIAAGSVQVTEHGAFRRVEEPGDCFGEIALLRDVPRTATVTALTDVELLALDREPFLAAITGDRRALAAGHALAQQRLGALR
jgi:MFS family permease